MRGSLLFQWKALCAYSQSFTISHSNHSQNSHRATRRRHRRRGRPGTRSLVRKPQPEIMETNLHTRSTQRKSSVITHLPPIPTHRVLAVPLRPRTSPLRVHRTLPTNHQHPQIRMSDVGRPPMGRHQRHLRRKSEWRARLPRLDQFLGRRSRGCGERQRRCRGHAEHFYRRPRTGERLGNGGVSLFGEFKSRGYRRWVCSFFFAFFLSYVF
jgi:hypothetical protein